MAFHFYHTAGCIQQNILFIAGYYRTSNNYYTAMQSWYGSAPSTNTNTLCDMIICFHLGFLCRT